MHTHMHRTGAAVGREGIVRIEELEQARPPDYGRTSDGRALGRGAGHRHAREPAVRLVPSLAVVVAVADSK